MANKGIHFRNVAVAVADLHAAYPHMWAVTCRSRTFESAPQEATHVSFFGVCADAEEDARNIGNARIREPLVNALDLEDYKCSYREAEAEMRRRWDALREATLSKIEREGMSENMASRQAGVSRNTIREWRAQVANPEQQEEEPASAGDVFRLGDGTFITPQEITTRVRGGGIGRDARVELETQKGWRRLTPDRTGLSGSGKSGSITFELPESGTYRYHELCVGTGKRPSVNGTVKIDQEAGTVTEID